MSRNFTVNEKQSNEISNYAQNKNLINIFLDSFNIVAVNYTIIQIRGLISSFNRVIICINPKNIEIGVVVFLFHDIEVINLGN